MESKISKAIEATEKFILRFTPEKIGDIKKDLTKLERYGILTIVIVLMCVLSVCAFKAASAFFSSPTPIKEFLIGLNLPIMLGLLSILATMLNWLVINYKKNTCVGAQAV